MAQCLFPSCSNFAKHNIGVRLRRPDTTAIWAPNTEAFLCDIHAAQGLTIDITLSPASNKTITTNVTAGADIINRTTPITNNP